VRDALAVRGADLVCAESDPERPSPGAATSVMDTHSAALTTVKRPSVLRIVNGLQRH
jgi:hypothetical protein